jgi:hypothetical protein
VPPGAFAETRAEDLRRRIIPTGNRVALLPPAALYRYTPATDTWTTLTSKDGLPQAPLTNICPTPMDLWITGAGASFSDPKVDDWQGYAPGEGYPGHVIYAVDSDEDYAYAGTDAGAARFDRYVLEWEPLMGSDGEALGLISDVVVGDNRVWFALSDGVAEYRKDAERIRIFSQLAQLTDPEVIGLRESTRFLWAVTSQGLARYDKDLETWTSYLPGVDFPDSRVHQVMLRGEDLWLGTDAGLWRYTASTGIWRRDDSNDQMPGERVFAFALDRGIWVVTEEAHAVFDESTSRWIDFTASVPLPPSADIEMSWVSGTLFFLGSERIVYAQRGGDGNPALFTYFQQPILEAAVPEVSASPRWRMGLDDSGLGMRRKPDEYVLVKGGVTFSMLGTKKLGSAGEQELLHETRTDLTLSGRNPIGRSVSGVYDTSDPDDKTYQLSYRGTREDVLRNLTAGQINQQFFNTLIIPPMRLDGGWGRGELGARSEVTRRRRATADGWLGERRTYPGRKVFYGPEEYGYKLDHENLVPGSEEIRVERQLLQVRVDYSINWESGSFLLADHVFIDDDTAIEVTYLYDISKGRGAATDTFPNREIAAGQLGLAPDDLLFLGAIGTSWYPQTGRRASDVDLNARFEYRDENSFLRVAPEVAMSQLAAATSVDPDIAGKEATSGAAAAINIRGRYRALEVTATQRNLDSDFVSMEDRRTLLGQLREESRLTARWDLTKFLQTTFDWDRSVSDCNEESAAGQRGDTPNQGTESLWLAGVKLLFGGWPNISFRRGSVRIDSLASEKRNEISRVDLELNPDPARLKPVRIKRLWLRTFFQRNDRGQRMVTADSGSPAIPDQIADQLFFRLNGSSGEVFSWGVDWVDRWTHRRVEDAPCGISRDQDAGFSLQLRPHASLDAFFNWDSKRELSYRETGGSDSSHVARSHVLTCHFHPGLIWTPLQLLSLRYDQNQVGSEDGGPGEPHPDAGSLWRPATALPGQSQARHNAGELRLQIVHWLRLIDRLESDRVRKLDLRDGHRQMTTRVWRFENRFEARPQAGLVIVRYVDRHVRELACWPAGEAGRNVTIAKRATADWNQTWGSGILTYVSLTAERTRDYRPQPSYRLTPGARLTYRQSRLRLYTSLGATYAHKEEDVGDEWGNYVRNVSRRLTLNLSFDIQFLRIFAVKLRHTAELPEGGATVHFVDLRLMIRA